ncbi:P-loop NTPase fold protein [Agromyces sp. NPDC058104]|uniref:KAP family P-loop NTPase fold protein n=1 Tax=Agromyces sp. NPDC058104 TaxID=3346342 RepID=UPI0036DD5F55
MTSAPPLTADDLVPDEPLDRIADGRITEDLDLLNHRSFALRVAQLATTVHGKLNIALFGPWGSGKSSFYGLLREELATVDATAVPLVFDAWRNAGSAFHTNFLSEIATQIKGADPAIANRLFQTTRAVNLPFRQFTTDWTPRKTLAWSAGILILLFLVIPFLFTVILNIIDTDSVDFWPALAKNIGAWAGFAASSSLIFIVITALLELTKVTVEEAAPGHVTQFSQLFDELLGKNDQRYIIFIDELDRCSAEDVMKTLEGLRTFLGHDRCVFVVAFDREAVSATIAKHMRHEVPERASGPYYQTSGEYLDKIFQFQISLPPQRIHTFRRYALSLVKGRGGLWAELDRHADRALERAISILTPIHLTSPRRTKVLLNDFAVNVRIFQGLGFDWLNRADEIAVLTVLQTEFPNLVSDMEREPELLRFIASNSEPAREPLKSLYRSYRTASKPKKDREPSDETRDLDAIALTGRSSSDAGNQLKANLHRYLQKLNDMGCTLPRADLLLMHADGMLVSFEDSSVYNLLLAAADAPISETASGLASASETDRRQSLTYLLEEVEVESAEGARALIELAGTVAHTLPSLTPSSADQMRAVWARCRADVSIISRLSTESLSGFAAALTVSFDRAEVDDFLDSVLDADEHSVPVVCRTLVQSIQEEDWASAASVIGSYLFSSTPADANLLAAFIERDARQTTARPDEAFTRAFVDRFKHTEPEPVTPASATVAGKQAAEEETEANEIAFAEAVEEAEASMHLITAHWADFPLEGATRPWLLGALRAIGTVNGWALTVHDRLIQSDIDRGLSDEVNVALLTACTDQPRHAAGRWVHLLDLEHDTDLALVMKAAGTLLRRGVAPGAEALTQNNAVSNVRQVVKLVRGRKVDASTLVAALSDAIEQDWDAWDEQRFTTAHGLLDAIAPLDPAETQRIRLYGLATLAADDDDELDTVVAAVRQESPGVANGVAETLAEDSEPTVPHLRVLLAAQEVALAAGEDVARLTHEQIGEAESDRTVVNEWIATAPGFDEVKKLTSLTAVSSSAWRSFSMRSTELDREQAWRALRKARVSDAILTAVAAGGMPDELYSEIVDTMSTGATTEARGKACGLLLTLPHTDKLTESAVEAVLRLSKRDVKSDVQIAARLLLAVADKLTLKQKAVLRKELDPWISRSGTYLTKSAQQQLANKGLAKAPDRSLFGRLFGT